MTGLATGSAASCGLITVVEGFSKKRRSFFVSNHLSLDLDGRLNEVEKRRQREFLRTLEQITEVLRESNYTYTRLRNYIMADVIDVYMPW